MSVSLPSIASFHQGAHSVAVVGLGYVGLPLAVAFARHFSVIGFDLNAARVEELLREQLLELGEDPATLAPHLIMQNMQCEVYPDDSMVYVWKDIPILRVVPERTDTGVMWRMFTRDEGEPLQ